MKKKKIIREEKKRQSPKCKACPYRCPECEKIDDARPRNYHGKEDTLCWCCANAVPGEGKGCEWSQWGRPVPGWLLDEIVRVVKVEEKDGDGARTVERRIVCNIVRCCPKFRRG